MNKPYVCHNCSTEFDLWPLPELPEPPPGGPGAPFPEQTMPTLIKVKCPGCYNNGYTSTDKMIYTVNLETMELVSEGL